MKVELHPLTRSLNQTSAKNDKLEQLIKGFIQLLCLGAFEKEAGIVGGYYLAWTCVF
jgi:hypothetical protein